MAKNLFNSNETLECCDATVSQQGNITVDPKMYNSAGMARLGVPEKAIRGRMKVEDGLIKFNPYEEGTRKPTYSRQVCVGSTMIQCTEEKVKFSFSVSRTLPKHILLLYIQSEIDEVKRRLALDVYDLIKPNGNENEKDGSVEKEGGEQ